MLLATQTAKRVVLYGRVSSTGEPLPIQVVWGLQNGHAAGASGLQAEHIKVWLRNAVRKEEEDGDIGLGDKWCTFVRLMQAIWEHGSVLEQMRWEIIVLLPKGNGEYPGIGLLDPFRKVMKKVMVARLALIQFHDSLHGGLSKRGTGTTTIKAKLHQGVAWRDQCPLYQIYIDLKKAYNALDRERMLNIFGGIWSRAKDTGTPEAFLGYSTIGVQGRG
jgi:hypothetical protein